MLAMADDALLCSLERLCGLRLGSLERATLLSSIEKWDSLRVVEFVALTDSEYGVTVDYEKLAGCQTVGDLIALVEEQRTTES